MIEVYYDGSCPLCRREIDWYRQRGTKAAFHDISQAANLPADLDFQKAMARLHIRDMQGQLRDGAAAFAGLWAATPGLGWLGSIAQFKPITLCLEAMYRLFLKIRPQMQWLFRRCSS